MKYAVFIFLIVVVSVLALAGKRGHVFSKPPIEILNDMDRQAKVKYQKPSAFFADGQASRTPVSGTVPMGFAVSTKAVSAGGHSADDAFTQGVDYYHTGRFGDYWGDGMPAALEVDEAFLKRGMERYQIHCAICHGESGNGKGVTSRYGFLNIANLLEEKFWNQEHADYHTDGDIFHTITHGKGLMGPYGANISVKDRWAIIAYLRVLQEASK